MVPSRVFVHPLEQRGAGTSGARTGGYCVLAEPHGPVHARVLEVLTERSAKVGTNVQIADDIGLIEIER